MQPMQGLTSFAKSSLYMYSLFSGPHDLMYLCTIFSEIFANLKKIWNSVNTWKVKISMFHTLESQTLFQCELYKGDFRHKFNLANTNTNMAELFLKLGGNKDKFFDFLCTLLNCMYKRV